MIRSCVVQCLPGPRTGMRTIWGTRGKESFMERSKSEDIDNDKSESRPIAVLDLFVRSSLPPVVEFPPARTLQCHVRVV